MIAPTLLVGLGGTGSKIVCKVSRLVTEEQREHLGFAVFDTDINELRDIQRDNPFIKIIQTSTKLSVGEYLNIDTHARDNWFPVNAILNSKTLTEGAGQVRAISRLAFDTALRAGKMEQLHEGIQELYKLDEEYSDYPKIAARIISKDPGNWYDTFMINKGSKDGIRVDNNVIAGKGLVGIVTEVGSNWATVRSIIDDSSNVSAMTVGTDDTCVVEGDLELIDEGKLRFTQLYDKEDKVTAGERIVTSNISEKYVEGLFIGYVSEISLDSNNLTKTGTLVTPVDFQHLKDVFVITVNKQDSIEEGEQ